MFSGCCLARATPKQTHSKANANAVAGLQNSLIAQPQARDRSEADGERFQPMEVVSVAEAGLFGKMQLRMPFEQSLQRHLQFEPRQRRADAEMNAGAERDVLLVGAAGPEDLGCGKGKRVMALKQGTLTFKVDWSAANNDDFAVNYLKNTL